MRPSTTAPDFDTPGGVGPDRVGPGPSGPDRAGKAWRVAQVVVWLVGVAMLLALVFAPRQGLHAFWNVLIPVAPALLVFAPGVWRNICPLASTALALRHVELSQRRRVSPLWQGRLALVGVLALYALVPLRHVILDLNGPATALTIAALAVIATVAGLLFEWKSAWCSGLCPVHPVERLYGQEPLVTARNMHCRSCERCVVTCTDSIPSVHPLATSRTRAQRLAGTLMVGGFVGFIWGWYQIPDYAGREGWGHLAESYGFPFGGLALSTVVFLVLRRTAGEEHRRALIRTFAAAAVACYYWYRIPALVGFGAIPGDGMLIDLRGTLPEWFPPVSRATTTVLFGWWLVIKTPRKRSWSVRPAYSADALAARVTPCHSPASPLRTP